jgi:hypothetical protein
MSSLKAMMKQYQTNATSSNKPKTSKKYDENNYFGTRLADGVNSAQKKVRILEPKGENESPFVEIMGHKKKVDGKYRTFVCPKHEKGEKCPFCEARELLLAEGTPESKKEAGQYGAKKMYVVKLIDRENPEHGVKFWRFNHHYKNAGTWDKIYAATQVLPEDGNPFSSTNGRDMIISITRDGKNSLVSGINYDFSETPLSPDAEQAAAWKASSDELTWNDVYSVKPYEYLEIIVRGGSPYWQKNANGEGGQWIDKASLNEESTETPSEEHDSELSMGVANAEASATATETVAPAPESAIPSTPAPVTETAKAEAPVVDDEEDDDLPF